jgi:IS5 family transposase
MYREKNDQPELKDFYLPFGGHLDSNNRWIRYAAIIPWKRIETAYAKLFSQDGMGAPAKSARIALGALLIKEKLDITDEETREQVRENPYLQYFIGMEGYRTDPPFDASMMVHFRKRFGVEALKQINEWIHEEQKKSGKKDGDGEKGGAGNKGKLIIDATCVPQDIQYPTDVRLLNDVREKTEKIIDRLHAPYRGKRKRPRTYRKKARKAYLAFCKRKRPREKEVRKAKREQLGYIRRNLLRINEIIDHSSLSRLSKRDRRDLIVGYEIYRQQMEMYREKKHTVSGRIVSISQPHVRPIMRGKAAVDVEFGAKVSISLVDGFTFVDRISWEPYNESRCFIDQVERYRERFGCYPGSAHVDMIYRTRENRTYCKERQIRMSGPKLGRRLLVTETNKAVLRKQRRIELKDERIRNAVEGKFGQGKRRFGLGRIFEKLQKTSESAIMLGFLVMNLEKIYKDLIFAFCECRRWMIFNMKQVQYWCNEGCF